MPPEFTTPLNRSAIVQPVLLALCNQAEQNLTNLR